MKRRWWALLALVTTLHAAAQPTPALDDAALAMQAVRLQPGEAITLDGTLSHPAWQRAPVFSRFEQKNPVQGAAPPQATRVQVLYDDRALYVGVTALEPTPERLRDQRVRHDGVNRTQDFVVVYLDAIGKRSSAQFFRVNVAGSTADGLHTAADDSEDFAPDFDWDAATARTPDGWTAVFRLPFASLRYAADQQDWRIMVARRLPREQFYLLTSVPIPNGANSFIATLQPLQGVQLPASAHFLTLRPGLTVRHTRRTPERGEPEGTKAEASLDVKWRPRAELVVDGTLNPDFSQVALDVPQLAGNSRFALFLTEKRPFFFESYDLLRTPTDALYTRSFTQPRAGLRATWRGSHWAGTAFAIRDRGRGLVLLPGAYGTDVAEQPASDSLTMRARHDDGNVALGGIASSRRYEQGGGENSVLGPDVSVPLGEWAGSWRLRGQWLFARTTALPDASGTLRVAPAQAGERLRLRALRQSEHGETALAIDDIDAHFRQDSGFVNQAGVRRFEGFHSIGWRGLGPFNELFINTEVQQVRDKATGELVSEYIRPGLWSAGARNLEWWLEAFVHSRLRVRAGAPLLNERYIATGLVMTPAPWVPLIDTSLVLGRLADNVAGASGQGEVRPGARLFLSAKLRPLKALEVEPSIRHAWLDRGTPEGRVRTYRETAQQWLAVWHFDARHTLRAIVQRSTLDRRAEPGLMAADELRRTESLTYAWRFSAGTRVYLGATRTRAGRTSPAETSEAFLKLELDADDLLAFAGTWARPRVAGGGGG
jgi:Domain of unknown function (DUF5916)